VFKNEKENNVTFYRMSFMQKDDGAMENFQRYAYAVIVTKVCLFALYATPVNIIFRMLLELKWTANLMQAKDSSPSFSLCSHV
jgi:hypothetical protein